MTSCNTGLIPTLPTLPAPVQYLTPAQHFTVGGRRADLEMHVEAPGEDAYDDEASVLYDDGTLAIFYDGLEYTGLMTKSPIVGQDGRPALHDFRQMDAARESLGLTLESWAETDFGYTLYYSKN